MKIRPATEADRDAFWNIFHEVVAAGDTYALDPNISRDDALAYWFAPGTRTYVAEENAVGDGVAVPGKLSASSTDSRLISATYVCVPGANQYVSASSREMFGSNAYVSPASTTSWKMFQTASRSASVAGRIFIAANRNCRPAASFTAIPEAI